MKKSILFLSLFALMFSCDKIDGDLEGGKSLFKDVSFKDGAIHYSKVTNNQFDNGDEINVKAFAEGIDCGVSTYSYSNSIFSSEKPFKLAEGVEFSYNAIYPKSASFSGAHQTNEDQSSAENYELSDLLVAKVDATNEVNPTLKFNHVMSSIVFNVEVEKNGVASTGDKVEVEFTLKNGATIDVAAESYVATGNMASITPYPSVGNGDSNVYNYSVVVAPQTVAANATIATVIVNDSDKFNFARTTDLELQSGKQLPCTFTVDIATKETNVEFGGLIGDWEDITPEPDKPDEPMLDSVVLTLANFSADSYPKNSEKWVITDTAAETADFDGLKAAFRSLNSSDSQISLSFPNLGEFPVGALANYYYDEELDSMFTYSKALVSVSAAKATIINDHAFKFCKSLTNISAPNVVNAGITAFNYCEALTSISLPAATLIKSGAFACCSALKSVELSSLDDIQYWNIFDNCYSLLKVTISSKVYTSQNGAFYSDDNSTILKYVGSLENTDFVTPSSVTTIPNTAFAASFNLTSVSLPGVTSLGMNVFTNAMNLTRIELPLIESKDFDWGNINGCSSLHTIKFKDKEYTAQDGVLYNSDKTIIYKYIASWDRTTFTAPSTVKEIAAGAFYDCRLKSISLPNVTTIGDNTFTNSRTLTSISIPNAITIGVYAFRYTNLSEISLPNVTSLGAYAFTSCGQLTSISLPEVTTIEPNTFQFCGELTSVSLPKVTTIGNGAFNSSGLTSIALPEVDSVKNGAFSYCHNLTSISLPKAVSIANMAFINCDTLTSVSLPEATIIGINAFGRCSALSSVSIPKAEFVESIAFSYCTSLTNFEIATQSTLAKSPFGIFGNTETENINLVVGNEATGVDVDAHTWIGCVFKSITLK